MKAPTLPKKFEPPVVYAGDLNALLEQIKRLSALTVGAGLVLEDTGSGRSLTLAGAVRTIDARLTGTLQETGRTADHALAAGVAAYSWVEIEAKPDGTWADVPNGLAGWVDREPAVEQGGLMGLAGIRVRLREGPAQLLTDGVPSSVWTFDASGWGGALRRGKLDGAMAYGGSAVLSVWAWNGTAVVDTGVNLTVYDWHLSAGQTIAAGKQVTAAFVGGQWVVLSAQC